MVNEYKRKLTQEKLFEWLATETVETISINDAKDIIEVLVETKVFDKHMSSLANSLIKVKTEEVKQIELDTEWDLFEAMNGEYHE